MSNTKNSMLVTQKIVSNIENFPHEIMHMKFQDANVTSTNQYFNTLNWIKFFNRCRRYDFNKAQPKHKSLVDYAANQRQLTSHSSIYQIQIFKILKWTMANNSQQKLCTNLFSLICAHNFYINIFFCWNKLKTK